jgi:hypothetical protein
MLFTQRKYSKQGHIICGRPQMQQEAGCMAGISWSTRSSSLRAEAELIYGVGPAAAKPQLVLQSTHYSLAQVV